MTANATATESSSSHTAIINRRVKVGREAEFEEAMRALIAFATACPGLEIMSMLRPADGGRDYTVVARFANAAARESFKATADYRQWMARLGELTEGDPQIIEHDVLDEWLRPPVPATVPTPPRYKTAVATFIGVYLLVVTLSLTLGPLIATWHFLIRHAIFNGLVVTLLAWVVMPVISRLLRPWLFPPAS